MNATEIELPLFKNGIDICCCEQRSFVNNVHSMEFYRYQDKNGRM